MSPEAQPGTDLLPSPYACGQRSDARGQQSDSCGPWLLADWQLQATLVLATWGFPIQLLFPSKPAGENLLTQQGLQSYVITHIP